MLKKEDDQIGLIHNFKVETKTTLLYVEEGRAASKSPH
jgi:hypothetical protein